MAREGPHAQGPFARRLSLSELAVHVLCHERLVLVTVLVDGIQPSPGLQVKLAKHVRKEIGAIAVPDKIQFAEALPKTRSGKIMRRILRLIAEKKTDDLGDISTLADPKVIESLLRADP